MTLSSSSFSSSPNEAFRFAEEVSLEEGGGVREVLGTGEDRGEADLDGFTRRGKVFNGEFGGGKKASGDRESIDAFNE